MVDNQIFKTILFPTDFTEESLKALHYVVELASACHSELIILHTYRLIGNGGVQENMLESKRRMEENARLEFQKMDAYMKDSNLRYSFLSEIGFVSDRIVSNIKTYGVDLVVLCENMQKRIKERSEKGYKGILDKTSCPIMLVPLAVADHNHLLS